LLQRSVDRKYLCTLWDITQAGERRLLQRGAHIFAAVHSPTIIIGGGFNCVLSQTDCTGNINYSKALDGVVRGFDLTDVWETINPRAIYTHYTPHGVACLDHMYLSPNLRN